jgi:hypothetical protein
LNIGEDDAGAVVGQLFGDRKADALRRLSVQHLSDAIEKNLTPESVDLHSLQVDAIKRISVSPSVLDFGESPGLPSSYDLSQHPTLMDGSRRNQFIVFRPVENQWYGRQFTRI